MVLTHEYLDASKATWHSTVYDHFDVTLHCDLDGRGQLSTLIFAFNCKVDPTHHTPHLRAWMSTGHGTKNFQDGVRACNKHVSITSTTTPVVNVHEPYSTAALHTLIAMHCTKNHRPFNSVLDVDYQDEVQMLCPGTILPSPQTVSCDIKAIYYEMFRIIS